MLLSRPRPGAKAPANWGFLGALANRSGRFRPARARIPASSCPGFSLIAAGTKPGDIAYAFAPLDLSDELVLPPSMFDTAGETPLKICNIGATALDPPSMTYTVYTIAG